MTETSESTSNSTAAWITATGLGIALVGPVAPVFVSWLAGLTEFSSTRLAWGVVAHWCLFAIILAWVRRRERQSLASIGVRPFRWWTVPLGVVSGAAILCVTGVLIHVLHLSSDSSFASYLLSQPWPTRLLMSITAGVFEETAYRGYALERLTSILGNKWLAGAITVLCFAFAHIPSVGLHIVPILIISSFVTLLYLWRRDLVLNMVAHATVDTLSLLILPAIAGR